LCVFAFFYILFPPFVHRCPFPILHKSTDHCHRVENQLQLINIIYHIIYHSISYHTISYITSHNFIYIISYHIYHINVLSFFHQPHKYLGIRSSIRLYI
jgi:hypothetical protein